MEERRFSPLFAILFSQPSGPDSRKSRIFMRGYSHFGNRWAFLRRATSPAQSASTWPALPYPVASAKLTTGLTRQRSTTND